VCCLDLKFKIALAFVAVYLIWGSTYLAIRFAIESMPPFLMAGTRFLLAGLVLYAWTRLRGSARESKQHWGNAFIIGGLMLLGGNGAVVWAEQWVPSSMTSLLIATVPLWMVLLDWIWNRARPNVKVIIGLALGFAGIALLVGGFENLGESSIDIVSACILIFGTFLWANGSLYSRSAKLPSSQFLDTGMEMIAGGLLLLLTSFVTGEWARARLDLITFHSLFSWIYLVVFGSLVAFTSYTWLLRVVSPSKVSTYAYVNPIVAMLLGWILAKESLNARSLLAAAIILASVLIIIAYQSKRQPVTGKD